ncbi:AAA family ATPase [Thermoproteota archaeon]
MVKKESDSRVWTNTYVPKKLKDVEGQEGPLEQLKKFVDTFKRQRKKAVLVYGDSGCGKTSAVYALANEMNLEVFELNASDFRNKDGKK